MDDLIAFLSARLDEDEHVARRATEGPWSVGDSDTNGGYEVYSEEGSVAIQGHYGGGIPKQADAEHIARHDPDRVLREGHVKRRIIDREVEKARKQWRQRVDEHRMTFDEWAGNFRWETLSLLASAYDDHPDYREDWRSPA